jgi:hypothetical protein
MGLELIFRVYFSKVVMAFRVLNRVILCLRYWISEQILDYFPLSLRLPFHKQLFTLMGQTFN